LATASGCQQLTVAEAVGEVEDVLLKVLQEVHEILM
jgi:hypothetical protein